MASSGTAACGVATALVLLSLLLAYSWLDADADAGGDADAPRAASWRGLPGGGGYRGRLWRKPNSTLSAAVVASSPFAQCEVHAVRHPTKPGVVIRDWLWFDEGDHVNVLVHGTDAARLTLPPAWIVLETTKYAFRPGRAALSPVGGYINDGETADDAARREVLEELGLECTRWQRFGEFRTAANRGGGFVWPFVARGCRPSARHTPSDDLEGQRRAYLDDKELRERLLDGSFQEIKWTATVALALLAS